MNVGQAFLHNPKDRRFQVGRLPFEIGRHFQLDLDTAPLFEPLRVPSESTLEPCFVQQRRVKKVGHIRTLSETSLPILRFRMPSWRSWR